MNPLPLLVTADDYAMDPGIDGGIREGIEAGGITGVSVWVAAAPYAFSPAEVATLKKADLGLHWGAFPPDVDLNRPRDWPWIKYLMAPSLRDIEIAEESWDRAADSLAGQGLPPRFINGHQHVHLFPGWVRPICRWAARRGMKVMRRPMEVGLDLTGLLQRRPAMAVLSTLGWFASRRCRRFPGHWIPAICRWGQEFAWEQALKELTPGSGLPPQDFPHGVEIVLHPGRPTVEYRRRTGVPGDHEGQLAQLLRPDLERLLADTSFRLSRFSAVCPT